MVLETIGLSSGIPPINNSIDFLAESSGVLYNGYKTELFSFRNNSKNLDPSYKMDLDLWDSLGRVKLVFTAKFHWTDLVSERGKPHLIAK